MLAAGMAWVVMLMSPLVASAAPQPMPRDIVLHDGGELLGQVVNAQGRALNNTSVVLLQGSKEVARTITDRTGRYSFRGLTGGVYEVATVGKRDVYRLWNPQTAPPAAKQGLLLVSDQNFVLGQDCGCGVVGCGGACGSGTKQGALQGLGAWLAEHPLLTAGTVAAAIAIPLAVDDDSPSSP